MDSVRKNNKLSMKNSIKLGLAVLTLAAATSSQAAYLSRDLLIGFNDGTTETIYDLGRAPAANQTWNLAAGLTGQYGIVGASTTLAQGQHIFASSSDPNQNGFMQINQWTTAKANVATIAGGA